MNNNTSSQKYYTAAAKTKYKTCLTTNSKTSAAHRWSTKANEKPQTSPQSAT